VHRLVKLTPPSRPAEKATFLHDRSTRRPQPNTVLPRIEGGHLDLSKIGDRRRSTTDTGAQHLRELVDPSREPRALFCRGRKRGLVFGLDTFLL
jgi:hypothetical protein